MSRQIIWQYGTSGSAGSGDNELKNLYSVVQSQSGNVLIADRGKHRVIEVDRDRQVIWQYGTSGSPGSGDNELSGPVSVVQLKNGNVLIADRGNHRAVEVDQ